MTKSECTNLLNWLSATWPRAYPPAMKDDRKVILLGNIEAVFSTIPYEEVKQAFVYALKTQDDVPTFAAIRNACLSAQKAEKAKQRAYNVENLHEHHPRRGCFYHKEALESYMADDAAGKRNGRNYSWYCKQYPAVEWRNWSMPELNADRFEPKGEWNYVTDEYKGWTLDERGFCVPKR